MSNTRIKLELKEFPRKEPSLSTEKKRLLRKFQEKSLLPTTMLLSILDNISHNTFQKNKSNMLPRKEKLKNTNTFQLKGIKLI